MKRIIVFLLLILNLFLITSCYGEETKFSFTPSFATERPVAYTFSEPKAFIAPVCQYKVQEIPLEPNSTYELLKPYLATEYGDRNITFDDGLFNMEMKSDNFLADSFPYAADYNLKGEQLDLLSTQCKNALAAINWVTENQTYVFTSFQKLSAYEAGTLQAIPLTTDYVKYIFHVPDVDTFAVTYRPLLKNYPVYQFIENGTEDQAAQNYAFFWLDKDGRIISAKIHAEYEIIKEAPIPTELLSWEKAVESVVQYAIPDDKRFQSNEAYELSYDVKNVEPCYIVDTNYVAVPGWEITLRKLFNEKTTGKTYYLDWVVAVNAVTGQLV